MQNITVRIPSDYFKSIPRKEYSNYKSALAREFVQNSDDAFAKNIRFTLDPESRTLRVVDDGVGMDEDTLVNRLLVLGGSKKGEGAVGGFGKAKELLFLAHKSFTIRTGNLRYTGQGLDGTLEVTEEFTVGTDITIELYEDEDIASLRYYMEEQLKKNETRAKVYFNGTLISGTEKLEFIKDLTDESGEVFAKMYLNRNTTSNSALIRVRGICMFPHYLNDEEMPQVIFELEGSSLDKLTANRDGMSWSVLKSFQEQVNLLVIDKLSATRKKPTKTEYINGPEGTRMVVSKRTQERASAIAEENYARYTGELVQALLMLIPEQDSPYTKQRSLRSALSKFAYPADFVLHYNCAVPAKIHPHSWNAQYRKIALTWEFIIKAIISALDMDLSYAIGWTLESTESGEYTTASTYEDQERGVRCFLLNPLAKENTSSKYRELVWELLESAIHEIAHLRVNYHDEVFVCEVTRIRRAIRHIDFYKFCKALLREEED